MTQFSTYEAARRSICGDAVITATFGHPGEGGYSEYRRTVGGARWSISNGPWDAVRPFTWTVMEEKPFSEFKKACARARGE